MLQKPKGTYDVYGNTGKKILYIEKLLHALMDKYNYEYFRTPLFEMSELFHRGVGETSDIVSKETYDFVDRGSRNLTLRPEGTAGIVRSYIENKMYGDNSLVKAWYFGPMYRYERPQSGRFREFYQFGVEAFGSFDAGMDAEVISIPVNLYKLLGLKGIKVKINSLGDTESRLRYKEALCNHFRPHLNELCDDCKNRFDKNPLRILDCKQDHNLDIMQKAPSILDYLNEESKEHFTLVQKYLKEMNIDFEVDSNIVRGLDYYTHTVFEVEADIEGFGSQNVLCAGGRYNGLVETLGGPSIPGVGFAFGLERLLAALDAEKLNIAEDNSLDFYIIPLGLEDKSYPLNILNLLRMNGFNGDMDYMNRSLKSCFKLIDKINPKYIIMIGENEINSNKITIKNNDTKEEVTIEKDKIVDYLDSVIGEE